MNFQTTTDLTHIIGICPPKGIVRETPLKITSHLPKGAQGQLIDAAILAEIMGHPINRQTTIRAKILAKSGQGVFASKHEAKGVASLLELMRKWHQYRGIPWACIWSREVSKSYGGHIHIGTHQDDEHTEPYIEQIAKWTGDARIYRERHRPDKIGLSEHDTWLVQCCTRRNQSGTDLAAYLGKDEPNLTTTGWRISKTNASKRVHRHVGDGGAIEGTLRTAYRHGTSRKIAPRTAASRKILEGVSNEKRLIRPELMSLPY